MHCFGAFRYPSCDKTRSFPPCLSPRALCVVDSVNEDENERPIAAPSVNLNFVPIRSGVTVSTSPLNFVIIERTGTRSSSEPLTKGLSGYTFPFGAVRPRALYLGINKPAFSLSSPS